METNQTLTPTFESEVQDIDRLRVPFEDLYTSIFLIRLLDDAYALVDAATSDRDITDRLLPALRARGVPPEQVRYLVLTHDHGDHAGGKDAVLRVCPQVETVREVRSLCDGVETVALPGHTRDFIGVLDRRSGTLITGDAVQGHGIGKYRCALEDEAAYLRTLRQIENDPHITCLLFSHAYEPWCQDRAVGRDRIADCLADCEAYVKSRHA